MNELIRFLIFAMAMLIGTGCERQQAQTEPTVKRRNPERIESSATSGTREAPAASATDGPFRVGPDVTMPKAIKRVTPDYPEIVGDHLMGILVLECVITRRGAVRDVRILKGQDNPFTRAIIAAIEQWRFEPGRRQGKPVDVIYDITVNHVPYARNENSASATAIE